MKKTIFCLIVLALLALNSTLPVTQIKKEDKDEKSTQETPDVETALEYERYLKEVVQALESDPDFRKKLDKAPEADIRSGKIALELDYVNHHVRTKLDEIKRRELDRLRSLANKEYELSNDIDREHLKVPQHLDHANEHSFEIEDLRKLIKKTSEDLAEADRKRRAEFKEYEMQKEFEHEMAMKEMTEEQRKQFQQEMEQQKEKHNKHEKIHQPGNKAQLEEVWEKQDHMDRQDFNPKTFFMIHDVDGNGFWDETEVKALFVKELDKVYQSGLAEDDMRERAEEMERMREHVFQETDTNHDGLISFQEFLEQTKREEFNKDPEWETVDQQPQYTHEEYLEFERRRKEEIDRMIAQGLLPPHPNMPQGYYSTAGGAYQHPAGYQQHHQQQQQHQPQHPQMHYQNQQQQYMQQQQHYQQQQYQQQQQQPHYQQQQPHQQQPQYQQQQPHQQQPHYQQQPHQQQQPQPIYQTHHEQPVQLHPNQVYQHVPPLSQSPGNTIHEAHPQPLVVEKMPIQQQQQQQQQKQPVESQEPKQQLPQTPIQSQAMNNHNHNAQQKQQNLINNNNNNIPQQQQQQPHQETIPIKH